MAASTGGRHRAPTPARPRYAAVATTAVLGAGLVAVGSGASASPDTTPTSHRTGSHPIVPAEASGGASMKTASMHTEVTAAAAHTSGRATALGANREVARASRSAARHPAPPQWVRPGTGYLSSTFAWRWGRHHNGIDLAAPLGSPIYAAGDGVVTRAGASEGFGNLIAIRHDDGVITWYGHEEKILVSVGERVHAGQKIALVGSLGNSTGPHLHFEVHVHGAPIDPIPWLRARGVRVA